FVEKPPRGAAPTKWINAGTYVLESSVLERVPAGLTVSIERETFPRMLDQRGRLYALQTDAYWIDIGTPDKYLQAHADVLDGRAGRPPAPGAAERSAGGWVQGDVTVDDGARLGGGRGRPSRARWVPAPPPRASGGGCMPRGRGGGPRVGPPPGPPGAP